jgi:hypothetical protein
VPLDGRPAGAGEAVFVEWSKHATADVAHNRRHAIFRQRRRNRNEVSIGTETAASHSASTSAGRRDGISSASCWRPSMRFLPRSPDAQRADRRFLGRTGRLRTDESPKDFVVPGQEPRFPCSNPPRVTCHPLPPVPPGTAHRSEAALCLRRPLPGRVRILSCHPCTVASADGSNDEPGLLPGKLIDGQLLIRQLDSVIQTQGCC